MPATKCVGVNPRLHAWAPLEPLLNPAGRSPYCVQTGRLHAGDAVGLEGVPDPLSGALSRAP